MIQLFPVITAILVSYFGILDFAELKSFDKRSQLLSNFNFFNFNRGRTDIPSDSDSNSNSNSEMTLVTIDQKSEAELGPWPWPHGVYASILSSIMPYKPKCVGILIWFDRESADLQMPQMSNLELEKSLFLLRPYDVPPYRNKKSILEVSFWRNLPKEFEKLAKESSFSSVSLNEEDGIYRQIQLLVKDKNEGHYKYSLELLMLCNYFGQDAAQIEFSNDFWLGNRLKLKRSEGTNLNGKGKGKGKGDELKIPIDRMGRMLITFYDPNSFQTVPFVDVLKSYQGETTGLDLQKLFANKVVLIGLSGDSAAPIPTPHGFQKALFLRAAAIRTILSEAFIARASKGINLGYIIFLCALSTLVAVQVSRKWQQDTKTKTRGSNSAASEAQAVGLGLFSRIFSRYKGVAIGNVLILLLHLALAFYLFYAYRIWIDMINPALALISSGICAILSLGYINLQTAQKQLVQSEREAAFGLMSAQVRHEIRNVLNSIRSPAEIVRNNLQKGDPLRMLESPTEIISEMDVIIQRVMKLNNMIEDELSFFQESHLQRQMLDIHEVISASLSITKQEMDDNEVQLRLVKDFNMPRFLIDEDKMRIVFINLTRNACQAMPDGGILSIRVRYQPNNSSNINNNNNKSNNYWKRFFKKGKGPSKPEAIIEIHDTGFGITPEAQKKIFEPFHTTKARGLGLGLVTVKNIVTRHGGRIEVESKPGEGTKFTIRLPATN